MIVSVVEGNLVDRFIDGLYEGAAHGCNCFCTMGKGIAEEWARRLPIVLEVDKATKKGDRTKMGFYSEAITPHGIVYNMYTQFTFWDKKDMLSYEAIECCFKLLNLRYKVRKQEKLIGIPRIGAGLARGDWTRIQKIINDNTPNVEIELVEYVPC